MNIGNKIFYNNKTGELLYCTGDMSGDVVEVPDEMIISLFNGENLYNLQDISVIQLEYEAFANKMLISVNIETQEIEWVDIPIIIEMMRNIPEVQEE